MPVTKKQYPEWVQQYRTRGKTVKKKGDAYYLYQRTSRRVPGKKYPQPVDTYIGIITPEGIVTTNRKKLTLSDIEVWEYGYSRAVMDLCPENWKKAQGEDWEAILKAIIAEWSDQSYYKREGVLDKSQIHGQFAAKASSLSRRFYKEYKEDISVLEPLKTVYLVLIGKEKALSKLNDRQKELIERYALKMEV